MSLPKDSCHNKTQFFILKKNQNRLPFLQSTNKTKHTHMEKKNLYKIKRERELRSEPVEECREVIQ